MYDMGKGVLKDYKEAVRWYQIAAEQGYSSAQHNLGLLYFNGRGVPQDHQEAVKWITLSADQGEVESQKNLGIIYRLSLIHI